MRLISVGMGIILSTLSVTLSATMYGLNQIRYVQGQVSDTLVVYTQAPVLKHLSRPFLPKLSSRAGQVTATFFVPAVTCAESRKIVGYLQDIIDKRDKKTALYSIDAVLVTQPVQGIKIVLTYKQDKLALQYYILSNKHTKYSGIMLLLHDKQAVNNLMHDILCCPIRWYSGIKHQPRIVIALDYTQKTSKNTEYLSRFTAVLRALLVQQGYEVFGLNSSSLSSITGSAALSLDACISYAQCQVQADLCIMLSWDKLSCSRAPEQAYKKHLWSTLDYRQKRAIHQVHACKRARLQTLVYTLSKQVDKALVDLCEYYDLYEMPLVALSLDKHTIVLEYAQALTQAIKIVFKTV